MNKLLVLLLIALIERFECEVFSSIDALENLAAYEKLIIEELQTFASQINDEYVNK